METLFINQCIHPRQPLSLLVSTVGFARAVTTQCSQLSVCLFFTSYKQGQAIVLVAQQEEAFCHQQPHTLSSN